MIKIATKVTPVMGFQYRLIITDKNEVIAINYYFNGKLIIKEPLKISQPLAGFNLDETISQFISRAVSKK